MAFFVWCYVWQSPNQELPFWVWAMSPVAKWIEVQPKKRCLSLNFNFHGFMGRLRLGNFIGLFGPKPFSRPWSTFSDFLHSSSLRSCLQFKGLMCDACPFLNVSWITASSTDWQVLGVGARFGRRGWAGRASRSMIHNWDWDSWWCGCNCFVYCILYTV